MVGGVVQLVFLLQELWWRSEESGETLFDTAVINVSSNGSSDSIVAVGDSASTFSTSFQMIGVYIWNIAEKGSFII